MSNKRTPIGAFVHSRWGNMNVRAGKYRHLQTKGKNKDYSDISIEFSREEFKAWCLAQQEHILRLKRPSIDRLDKKKNYTLDNMQIIELAENIRKEKTHFKNGFGICRTCSKRKPEANFTKDKRRINGRIPVCQDCERLRGREKYSRLYKTTEYAK